MTGLQRVPTTNDTLRDFVAIAEKVDANLNLLMLSVFHEVVPQMSGNDSKAIISGINNQKQAAAGISLPKV